MSFAKQATDFILDDVPLLTKLSAEEESQEDIDRRRRILALLAATAGLAGVGYGAYKGWQALSEAQKKDPLPTTEDESVFDKGMRISDEFLRGGDPEGSYANPGTLAGLIGGGVSSRTGKRMLNRFGVPSSVLDKWMPLTTATNVTSDLRERLAEIGRGDLAAAEKVKPGVLGKLFGSNKVQRQREAAGVVATPDDGAAGGKKLDMDKVIPARAKTLSDALDRLGETGRPSSKDKRNELLTELGRQRRGGAAPEAINLATALQKARILSNVLDDKTISSRLRRAVRGVTSDQLTGELGSLARQQMKGRLTSGEARRLAEINKELKKQVGTDVAGLAAGMKQFGSPNIFNRAGRAGVRTLAPMAGLQALEGALDWYSGKETVSDPTVQSRVEATKQQQQQPQEVEAGK